MKILIYGENWEGTLPNLLYNALINRGHDCSIFDFTDIMPGIKERSLSGRIKRRLFPYYYSSLLNRLFLLKCQEVAPDIVFIAKGFHLKRKILRQIKNTGAFLINWNPDDFLNMKNSCKGLILSIPEYDLIVSPREHRFEIHKQLGAGKQFFVDWYYVPGLHKYNETEYKYDASFVGSWSQSREAFIDQLDMHFHIWGGGWEKSSARFRTKNSVYQKILNQREMSAVFAASKYNLNMLTHENDDRTNLRMFEVTASGGLLLTERNESVERYFIDESECLTYSDITDINRIFSSNYDTKKIAMGGLVRVTNDGNSFEDRVDCLMEAIGKDMNA